MGEEPTKREQSRNDESDEYIWIADTSIAAVVLNPQTTSLTNILVGSA